MMRLKAIGVMFMLAAPMVAHADASDAARVTAARVEISNIRARVLAQVGAKDRKAQAQVGRAMKALGAFGLEPLAQLVVSGEKGVPAEARETLMVGALEALGKLRDRRTAPVLVGVLESSSESSSMVVRAAAQALGMMCADEDLSVLQRGSAPGARWEREALSGFRTCRREAAARYLAGRFINMKNAEVAREAAQALGYLGSSWAWEALGPERAAEGAQVRAEVAAALTAALPNAVGKTREAIEDSLKMLQ